MEKKALMLLIGFAFTLPMVLSILAGGDAVGASNSTPGGKSTAAPAPGSPSNVLPPSIMPVVILKGSDYDMGYQYGQQAGPWMEKRKEALWAAVSSKKPEEVQQCLEAFEGYIKQYAPEAITILKGMVDGAKAAGSNVTYKDALMLNWSSSSVSLPTRKTPAGPGKITKSSGGATDADGGCSHFCAWGSVTPDGKLVCGDSSDQIFGYQVTLVMFPDQGNAYVSTALAGDLARHPAFNNKGVFLGSSGGFARRNIDSGYGLSRPIAVYQMIRFANTAKEAKDMFIPWKYAGGNNFSLSDVSGDAYVVEVTAACKGVRRVGDFGEKDFIYATNNYFTRECKDAIMGEKWIEHAGWIGSNTTAWNVSSIFRNIEFWNLFQNYRGKIGLEFAKMIYRFDGNPPPSDKSLKTYLATHGKGWDPRIANSLTAIVAISQPDKGDKGAIHVCTGPASRTTCPLFPGAGCDDYQIENTYTFYRLTLAAGPAATVTHAKNDAKDSIAATHGQLMKMKFTDLGYRDLNEQFSVAKTKYYEGLAWQNKALLAKGNEALLFFAEAASAFTSCQAYAKQVYEAMVPPPRSPKDLGLGDYLGSWGKWATK